MNTFIHKSSCSLKLKITSIASNLSNTATFLQGSNLEIKIALQKNKWIARKIAPCRLKKCSSFVKHFSNFAKRIFEACNFFNLAFIIEHLLLFLLFFQ